MRHFRKIAIIGVGLLGGSLAKDLKGKKGIRLMGWNHRASSRKKASKLLNVADSFEEAARDAEIVVLCSHSSSIAAALKQLSGIVRANALIMDVSSVKGTVVNQACRISDMSQHFVPCHPMAGKETSGPKNAETGLYRGKTVFITPLPKSPQKLIRRAAGFWKSVGAVPIIMDAKKHDRQVALTSHLPHLLACSLMEIYGNLEKGDSSIRNAVGPGFRDFTRIAAGNPGMWSDIMRMNAPRIASFLGQYRRKLAALEKNLRTKQNHRWFSFFLKSRTARERLGPK